MKQQRPNAPAPDPRSLEAAAAAVQVDPNDIVLNSHDREIVKGNQTRSHVLLHSPAMLQLLSLARARLLKVAQMRKMETDLLLRVRAALRKSTRQIYIWPVDEDDPEGIAVNDYDKNSTLWINLISLLGDTNLQVPTGYRDRYQATIVEKDESPVGGPALMFSLSRRISRTLKPAKPDGTTAAAKTGKTTARKQTANLTSTDQKKAEPTQPTPPETTVK